LCILFVNFFIPAVSGAEHHMETEFRFFDWDKDTFSERKYQIQVNGDIILRFG